ncbi:hypothetical protein Z957_05125 [Clostridium sp. K25]|uniref:hypothetical protein n=1 Tax=Clostridium sp. K25 TaxID=1443109 RepID=UPI0004D75CD3|nr:hypothetical protein [Clostridium sp. K25]KEI09289.1 hypothetical protein Z957_05125 [Clostridium sp. K25]
MNLYKILKDLIEAKHYKKEDMANKLNVFYAFNQINSEEYTQLMDKVNPKAKEEINSKII